MDLTICVMDGQKPAPSALRTVQGTLQRVQYQRKEITLIAQGKVWRFALRPDCQLWFNDTQSMLRCFHPLDTVTVHFDGDEQVVSMQAWVANAA